MVSMNFRERVLAQTKFRLLHVAFGSFDCLFLKFLFSDIISNKYIEENENRRKVHRLNHDPPFFAKGIGHSSAMCACVYVCAQSVRVRSSISHPLLPLPGSVSSASSQSSGFSEASAATPIGSGGQKDYGGLDFKIVVDFKNGSQVTIHLVAPSMQEKAAWTSDISQVRPYIFPHAIFTIN